MNRRRHRVIFNAARALLMVVAETASTHGHSGGTSASQARPGRRQVVATVKPLVFSIWAALGLVGWPSAQAQIVADPNAAGSQRPTILAAPNGVPLVNIQTPSAAGVSRNAYGQFDVQQQGVILNNSRTNAPTQLGGWVQGNPWLAGGSARVILNEINSSHPSLLRGHVETAGQRAQVVIANPAGVTCDGCGFINASRVTITTGSPIVNLGSLDGYRVQGGTVAVTGLGLDAGSADYTDILARAAQISAGIWANQLNVVTGHNDITVASADGQPRVSGAAPATGAAPAFALDTAALGGMYAGKIAVVATEAGVGVRHAGKMYAAAGDVVVTADGRLESSGHIAASNNVHIDAGAGIQTSGTVYAQGHLDLATLGDIENRGTLAAAGNASLLARGAESRIISAPDASLAAGVGPDGSFAAAGDLAVNATQAASIHGESFSGGDQHIAARVLDLANANVSASNFFLAASHGDVNLTGATLAADGVLGVNATHALRTDRARVVANQINVAAHELSNIDGEIVQQGGGELSLDLPGTIDNSQGRLAANGAMFGIGAATLINTDGKIEHAGTGSLTIRANTLTGARGTVLSNGTLRLAAPNIVLDSATTAADRLELDSVVLSHRDGTMVQSGEGAANIAARDRLDNADGLIQSNGDLSISVGELKNRGGTIQAAGSRPTDLAILAGSGIDNGAGGIIAASGNAGIVAGATVVNEGLLAAAGRLDVQAASIDNRASASILADRIRLQATDARTLTNRGLINGAETLLEAQSLNNLGTGRIYGDHVAVAAATLVNAAEDGAAPVIAARDRLDIGAGTIGNSDHAVLLSEGELAIGGNLDAGRRAAGQAGVLNNDSATIEAAGNMSLRVGTLNNRNRNFSTTTEQVSVESITEYAGSGSPNVYREGTPGVYVYNDESDHLHTPEGNFETWGALRYTRTVTETRVQESDPARITAGGAIGITADVVNNDKSHIIAGASIGGSIGALNNVEAAGERVTTDAGTATSYWRNHRKGRDRTASSTVAYNPAPSIQAISLTPAIYRENTLAVTSGVQAAALADPVGMLPDRQGISPITQVVLGGSDGAGHAATVVRSGGINTRVPGSSLFGINPDPTARYIVETDPAFANHRSWLGSDYLLQSLSLDPAAVQKRLGDGFYEQKLVREQVAQLTGRRFLEGHADDEAQFAALMDSGASFAQAQGLIPGVALSASQMAALTSDIVWLVEKNVTLADGSSTRALVPQLYVRVRDGDLESGGALLAGNDVQLNLTGNLENSGTIAGRRLVAINAENIRNSGGRIFGNDIDLAARSDLDNMGGAVAADSSLVATAGRDVNVVGTTRTQVNGQGSRTNLERVAGLYVTGAAADDGVLVVSAGRDVRLVAAVVQNSGGGATAVTAQNDLDLGTAVEASSDRLVWDASNHRSDARTVEVGTAIQSRGDLALTAGKDLNARGAEVTSTAGNLGVHAGRDVNLTASEASVALDEAHRFKGRSSIFSSKTITTRDTLDQTSAQATSFSGRTVAISADRDIVLSGSDAVSDVGTTLVAGGNLSLGAATETTLEGHFREEKKSGIFGSGGLGFTIGSRRQSVDRQAAIETAAPSTIGSIEGDINLQAVARYVQTGSDVLAPRGNVSIGAERVEIVEAREHASVQTETRFRQSGLTVALSNPVISAIQTTRQMAKAAQETDNPRMRALAASNIALATRAAVADVRKGQGSTIGRKDNQIATGNKNSDGTPETRDATLADKVGGINISISFGSSRSQSNTVQESDTAAGSQVVAGGDVVIDARGAGAEADLVVQGSRIEAGGDVRLHADDSLQLLAAQNTSAERSSNQSSSASLGISFGIGVGTLGFGVTASASQGRGNADGSDLAWTHSRIEAGQRVLLDSGADTTIRGAVVRGDQVVANVAGDLTLQSLQDTSHYDSSQKDVGASLTVGIGRFDGSFNSGGSRVNGTYASTAEQTAIVAGDTGFQISVAGHTDLQGAVIASTDHAAQEGKNSLTTGTLSVGDIANSARGQASSSNLGVSTSMFIQGKYGVAKGVLANLSSGAKTGDESHGQARAAISPATIVLTDEAGQIERTGRNAEQTVASLDRDVASANVPAQRPDTARLERTVQAELAIKQETVRAVTLLADETYRSRFLEQPTLWKVECKAGGNACVLDPSLLVRTPATAQEIAEAGAKSVIAVNGIFNDVERGAEQAYQNALPDKITKEKPSVVYVMHIAPADNMISELMGVAYEKIVASADYGLANFLGYTNGQELYADLLRSRGEQETTSLGHSRGVLIQEGSFEILANRPDANGQVYTNKNLTVRGVAGASNALTYSERAIKITGEDDKGNVTFAYFDNDPVSVVAGGNVGMTSLSDLWQIVDTSNSMHSCMGTGARGCTQVEAPIEGGWQGTPEGNSRLVTYQGGVRVDPQGKEIQK